MGKRIGVRTFNTAIGSIKQRMINKNVSFEFAILLIFLNLASEHAHILP
jgi:hypothetical protein